MFRSSLRPWGFEYNPQASVDHEEEPPEPGPAEKRRLPRAKRPNYKPTALTWPFIVAQIAILSLALGLIIWAEKAMPNSDNTAIIDPLPSDVGSLRVRNLGEGEKAGRQLSATTRGDVTAGTGTLEDAPTAGLTPSPIFTVVTVDQPNSSSTIVAESSSDGGTSNESSAGLTTAPGSARPLRTSQDGAGPATSTKDAFTTVSPASSGLPTYSLTDSPTMGFTSLVTSSDGEQSSTEGDSAISTATSDSGQQSETGTPEAGFTTTKATEPATTETGSQKTDIISTSSQWPSSATANPDYHKHGIITLTDATATQAIITKSTSIFTSNYTITRFSTRGNYSSSIMTVSESTLTFNTTSIFVTSTDVTITLGGSVVPPSTIYLPGSSTVPPLLSGGQPPPTSIGNIESVSYTVVPASTLPSVTVVQSTITSTTIFETTSGVPAATKTVGASYVPYLETGQTVITSVQTVVVQPPQTQQQKTQAVPPETFVQTKIEGGEVYTSVETFAPQTQVITGGAVTQVITPPPQTILTQVGGHVSTSYMVVTPTYTTETAALMVLSTVGGESQTVVQTQPPQVIVTSKDGTLATLVTTFPPQTQVTVIGGTATTIRGFMATTVGGESRTIIQTQAAQTIVTSKDGTVATLVTTPPPQTQVTVIGGTLTTVPAFAASTIGGDTKTIVQTQAPQTIVTSKDGKLVTVITTPPPQTQVTVIGGTITKIPLSTTYTGYEPITYEITATVGGSTSILIETGGPTKLVTTINGTPTTRGTTVPPRTYTTAIGGTLTTQTFTTTPTNSSPITLTFVNTISGTLTTSIQTFPPTTHIASISGTLTTIISTPSPSTHLSTRLLHTTTVTSTSTPDTASPSPLPSETALIVTTQTFDLTSRTYFLATFLPPILAVAIILPLRIVDLNAKLYQPFVTLATQPSPGHESLTLQFTGLMGFITPVVTLLQGHPVPFITTLVVLASSLFVPLAVEAISLKLHGHCSQLSSRGCAAAIGVSTGANHALMGVVGFVMLLLVVLGVLLRGWTTGVRANPWSIAGIASLAGNSEVRIRAAGEEGMRREVGERVYGLGWYEVGGREGYGLVLAEESSGLAGLEHGGDGEDGLLLGKDGKEEKRLPFMTLRWPWRVGFMVYLTGLLVLIAYYDYTLVRQQEGTGKGYTRFHLFFDSHDFGIRFMFASMGVIITFCWQAFFIAVATILPYTLLALCPQPSTLLLTSRPTNPFTGLSQAIRLRHPFYTLVSLASTLSEFLPILLSNIPHKLTQVLVPTLICTRISLALLAFMLAVLAGSFWCVWPPMPVDPRSLAGAMWYVGESRGLLDDLSGVGETEGRERDWIVRKRGGRFYYGEVLGSDTRGRLGIDVVSGLGVGDGVDTVYRGAKGLEGDGAPLLVSNVQSQQRAREFDYKSMHKSEVVTTVRSVGEGLELTRLEAPSRMSFSERLRARSHERLL